MAARILIVNDELGLVTIFRIIIQRAGYQTLKAMDGLEGFEMAKTHIPDLVLSDTLMPKASGRMLLQMLRQEPTTSHIPFILTTFSGNNRLETDVEWIEDMQLIINPPIDASELINGVQKLLSEKGIQ